MDTKKETLDLDQEVQQETQEKTDQEQKKEELRFDLKTFFKPYRLEGESQEKYRERQRLHKLYEKQKKQSLWWTSIGKVYDEEKGKWLFIGPYTYDKKKFAAAKEAYEKHIQSKETNK